jgi:hypothetical protein
LTTIVDITTTLAARVGIARDAVGQLHDADQALRAAHAAAEAERGRLLSARPPKADVIAVADARVDAIGTAWSAAHGMSLVTALAGSVDVAPDGAVRGILTGDLALAGPLDAPTLIALAPDVVKAGLRKLIEATPDAGGPSMRERPQLIADVDVRIADVEAQHSALVDQARTLGITLDLLESVRGRRVMEAQRAEFRDRTARDLARKVR